MTDNAMAPMPPRSSERSANPLSNRTLSWRGARAIVALAAVLGAGSVDARPHRILFRGSEAVAIASATGSPLAGYFGTPSASGPVCVPGGTADANFGAGVPNQMVTFLHPYTNQAVTIPLTLPVGKPRIITRPNRIIYDYGLFRSKVVVHFREDGLIEVEYRG